MVTHWAEPRDEVADVSTVHGSDLADDLILGQIPRCDLKKSADLLIGKPPAGLSCEYTANDRIRAHMLCYNRMYTHDGTVSDRKLVEDNGVPSDPHVLADDGGTSVDRMLLVAPR